MNFLIIIYLFIFINFINCNPQIEENKRQNFAADNQQFSSFIQNVEHSLEERHNERDGERTAFAVITNKNIVRPQQQQKQPFNSVALNGENKQFFKIHYRDGIQKAIFDETQRRVPPDFEESNDLGVNFDIYDDNNLIEPHRESSIFVPLIYRNETSSEEAAASNEKKRILLPTFKQQQKIQQTIRPLVAPELLGRQQITIRTTSPKPTTTTLLFNRQSQQQTIAQLVPSQTILPIIQQTIRPPLNKRPSPPPPQQFQQQNFQQQSRFISTQPPPQQPQTLPTNRNFPIPNENIANIRTGVCQQSIFYTTQQVTGIDILKAYTHFAVVVSVDQCARTCHEFNCDVAILDPNTKHCQFNPSTAFQLSPECPRWPNPLYKNNFVFGTELIRIQCITCQKKKKRILFLPNAQRLPPLSISSIPGFNSRQQQQTFNFNRPQQQQQFNNNQNNNEGLQRVANAVKTSTNKNNFEINQLVRPTFKAMGKKTDLRDGFINKLNRQTSIEDYFDINNNNEKNENNNLNDGNVIKRPLINKEKNNKIIKQVVSWREGHPQGDDFSPLKINPLKNWRRPTINKNNIENTISTTPSLLAPLQPIFKSTENLLLKRVDGGITSADELTLLRRRTK